MEWIEKEKVAAWVIVVSPNTDPKDLADLAKASGLERTLVAVDPANSQKVGRNNVVDVRLYDVQGGSRQVDGYGKGKTLACVKAAEAASPGVHAIPVSGLTEAGVIEAWWRANRGLVPGALKELAGAAKRKGAVGEQALAVVTSANTVFTAALAAVGDGFEAYEKLEGLQRRFDGLDLKALKERASTLAKDATVKKEIKARSVYLECQRLIASSKPKDQAAGRDGLIQLAKAMAGTKYGDMAGK